MNLLELTFPEYLDEATVAWLKRQFLTRTTGLVNQYTCEACMGTFTTVDLTPGVTPFTTRCQVLPNCRGYAKSHMYRLEGWSIPVDSIHWGWDRPETLEGVDSGLVDHYRQGGLTLVPLNLEERLGLIGTPIHAAPPVVNPKWFPFSSMGTDTGRLSISNPPRSSKPKRGIITGRHR